MPFQVTLERVAEHLSLKDAFYFLYDNKRIRIEYRELLLSLREARLGNVDAIKMLHLSWEVVELLRVYFPQDPIHDSHVGTRLQYPSFM